MKVKAENIDVMGGMMNIGKTQVDVLTAMSDLEWWTGKKLNVWCWLHYCTLGDARKAVQRLVGQGLAESRIADSKIFRHEYRLTGKGVDAAIACRVAK